MAAIGTISAGWDGGDAMNYSYPKSIRYVRLSRGMQIALEIAVAVSSALFMSYLILHGIV